MSASLLFDAPGPKARARYRLVGIIGGILVAAFIAFVLYQAGVHGNLEPAKWTPFLTAEIWQYYLLPGLANTLKAAAISIVLAGIFGLVFGTARLSHRSDPVGEHGRRRVLPVRAGARPDDRRVLVLRAQQRLRQRGSTRWRRS